MIQKSSQSNQQATDLCCLLSPTQMKITMTVVVFANYTILVLDQLS